MFATHLAEKASKATYGHVKIGDGLNVVDGVLSAGGELVTEKFITPGTFTWTVPLGVKKVYVSGAGGGGGGGVLGTVGGTGGLTSFGNYLSLPGGGGGYTSGGTAGGPGGGGVGGGGIFGAGGGGSASGYGAGGGGNAATIDEPITVVPLNIITITVGGGGSAGSGGGRGSGGFLLIKYIN